MKAGRKEVLLCAPRSHEPLPLSHSCLFFGRLIYHEDWEALIQEELNAIRSVSRESETSTLRRLVTKSGKIVKCIQVKRVRYNSKGLPIAKISVMIPITD